MLLGDNKRKVPLKALVPEVRKKKLIYQKLGTPGAYLQGMTTFSALKCFFKEYRGCRYYTDVHMEVVEKRNAMPKVWRGPYSIMTPHR